MEIDISNEELNYLLEIVKKEISMLEKEIHRTDALVFKSELKEKARSLNDMIEKLQLVLN